MTKIPSADAYAATYLVYTSLLPQYYYISIIIFAFTCNVTPGLFFVLLAKLLSDALEQNLKKCLVPLFPRYSCLEGEC